MLEIYVEYVDTEQTSSAAELLSVLVARCIARQNRLVS